MARKSNTVGVNPVLQLKDKEDVTSAGKGGRGARTLGKLPDPKDPNARKRHFLTYGAGVPFPGDQPSDAVQRELDKPLPKGLQDVWREHGIQGPAPKALLQMSPDTNLLDLPDVSPSRKIMFAGTEFGKLLGGDTAIPQDVVKVGDVYACGRIAREAAMTRLFGPEDLMVLSTPAILTMNPAFAAALHKEMRVGGGLNGSDRKAFKSFRRSAKALTKAFLKEVKCHG